MGHRAAQDERVRPLVRRVVGVEQAEDRDLVLVRDLGDHDGAAAVADEPVGDGGVPERQVEVPLESRLLVEPRPGEPAVHAGDLPVVVVGVLALEAVDADEDLGRAVIARGHPGVLVEARIDAVGLPEHAQRAHVALGVAQARDVPPVAGRRHRRRRW